MSNFQTLIATLILTAVTASAVAAQEPKSPTVAALQDKHDRALLQDLKLYINEHPKAEDVEQAYMLLFNKAIEHDWFAEHEAIAARYLADQPDGPIQSLARIVSTMSRAQAGKYAEALGRYKELMRGLGKDDQEEFAANFTDTLANAATAAGEYSVARQVYETLLERYGESPTLRQKIQSDLSRLDKVNKPAPDAAVKDVKGAPLRLADLKGKYVLVDFWATWCAPCIAELPNVQEAYAKYHGGGFEVVGVSLDETKTALLDFVKARNIPWRQVHNSSSGGDLVEAFGVNSIPATFLIDPEGTIIRLELRGPALDQALAKLIKTPAVTQRAGLPVR
ncbi:Peroxiredoxin [Singulisphaera sp. GP187]|uniref:TlpA disulfide reductase family protein n=1 Tax=Singulisphaera sp. GP187 TaxID=1882752 RepID=UPI0009279136|nr:TlpA disulfide reductase family protein [Singulisphaera sp. GP187]SIO08261.1 Peroxiredoxin [Singulisphaera sp. GP187]